jgi:putative ABC transport system ATP-binding protein
MITAKEVTKVYHMEEKEVRALDGVDVTIKDGEFVIIIGRSGSGKSTLLSVLGGLTRPSSGSIMMDGKELWSMSDHDLSVLRSHHIGFVFQFPGLLPTLTALENVMLPAIFVQKKEKPGIKAKELLTSLGLADKYSSYPHQLSGGELKRASIARALMNDPTVILADEPTGDLDAETEMEIMEEFKKINKQGRTIIMVTHNPDLSVYASTVLRMEKGKMRNVGGT